MYPKLIIDLKKLENNLNAVAEITKDRGHCSLMIVTKGLCADKEMVKMVAENPTLGFYRRFPGKEYRLFCGYGQSCGKKDRAS